MKTKKNGAIEIGQASLDVKYPDGVILDVKIKKLAESLACHSDIPVSIMGMTGTGKEFFTKYIQACREKLGHKTPFIAINCALLNGELAESYLFGHRKGAFTGANEHRKGAVEEADGGILFLDEVQCLSIAAQQKLLRLLNDKTFCRMGETELRKSNFQIITASNRDLEALVEQGSFLLDVYMRISGFTVRLPTLSEQPGLMGDLFLKYLLDHGIELDPLEFDRILNVFLIYDWPGNLRQFFRILDSMRLRSKIEQRDFTAELIQDIFRNSLKFNSEVTQSSASLQVLHPEKEASPIDRAIQMLKAFKNDGGNLEKTLLGLEKAMIEHTFAQTKSLKLSMEKLGLTRNQLDFKRRKFGLLRWTHPEHF